MDAVVTGGAGFIGSNLAHRLVANGVRVRVIDDLSTGRAENLDGLDAELIVKDIRRLSAADLEGVEVVYHLGALPSVRRSVEDPLSSHAVNATGTLAVLEAARAAGVRRVVYASSSSVYGDTEQLPKHEAMPVNTLSPYASSKLSGEAYCRAYARSFGLETVSLRFFNVFGPRQDPTSEYAAVIPRFITSVLRGDAPEIYGDGLQSRDFTFIANVVEACILSSVAGAEAIGETFNVGCGSRVTLLDLLSLINASIGTTIEPRFAPARVGDVRHSQASIAKAKDALGYEPAHSLADGLAATIEWFQHRLAAATDHA